MKNSILTATISLLGAILLAALPSSLVAHPSPSEKIALPKLCMFEGEEVTLQVITKELEKLMAPAQNKTFVSTAGEVAYPYPQSELATDPYLLVNDTTSIPNSDSSAATAPNTTPSLRDFLLFLKEHQCSTDRATTSGSSVAPAHERWYGSFGDFCLGNSNATITDEFYAALVAAYGHSVANSAFSSDLRQQASTGHLTTCLQKMISPVVQGVVGGVLNPYLAGMTIHVKLPTKPTSSNQEEAKEGNHGDNFVMLQNPVRTIAHNATQQVIESAPGLLNHQLNDGIKVTTQLNENAILKLGGLRGNIIRHVIDQATKSAFLNIYRIKVATTAVTHIEAQLTAYQEALEDLVPSSEASSSSNTSDSLPLQDDNDEDEQSPMGAVIVHSPEVEKAKRLSQSIKTIEPLAQASLTNHDKMRTYTARLFNALKVKSEEVPSTLLSSASEHIHHDPLRLLLHQAGSKMSESVSAACSLEFKLRIIDQILQKGLNFSTTEEETAFAAFVQAEALDSGTIMNTALQHIAKTATLVTKFSHELTEVMLAEQPQDLVLLEKLSDMLAAKREKKTVVVSAPESPFMTTILALQESLEAIDQDIQQVNLLKTRFKKAYDIYTKKLYPESNKAQLFQVKQTTQELLLKVLAFKPQDTASWRSINVHNVSTSILKYLDLLQKSATSLAASEQTLASASVNDVILERNLIILQIWSSGDLYPTTSVNIHSDTSTNPTWKDVNNSTEFEDDL